jgi:aspartate kinase
MNHIFVEKFGGASVKSAEGVRNVASIIKREDKKRLVVISAMGKTTNALEKVVGEFYSFKHIDYSTLQDIKDYHTRIIQELFENPNNTATDYLNQTIEDISLFLLEEKDVSYSELYDAIVSFGEKICVKIISEYLFSICLEHKQVNAFENIVTDSSFRMAKVKWQETQSKISQNVLPLFINYNTVLTQGFIASNSQGQMTTLGREGSDFSASVFAYCLSAQSVTIWKDVAGLMNADPKRMPLAQLLEQVPYAEAIELSYYGASVIHPKTLKPLENRNIPLYVKSFLCHEEKGSAIGRFENINPNIPSFIFKDNQMLLSITPEDFSFVVEENLSKIFSLFTRLGIKINLMQNSALSFSVCFDMPQKETLDSLIAELSLSYLVKYNDNLTLVTIRRYTPDAIVTMTEGKTILLQQLSRLTAQFLILN